MLSFRLSNESRDMAPIPRHLSAIYCQTKPAVSCHLLNQIVCRWSPSFVKIYCNLPAVWLTYCLGEDSQARMTATLSMRGALTPLQFSSDLISTRLHSTTKRRERKEQQRESSSEWKWPLRKRTWKNGPALSVVSLETGASEELHAATANDTNDPMTAGKRCWSVNLALDNQFYVGQSEQVLPQHPYLKMTNSVLLFYQIYLKMTRMALFRHISGFYC